MTGLEYLNVYDTMLCSPSYPAPPLPSLRRLIYIQYSRGAAAKHNALNILLLSSPALRTLHTFLPPSSSHILHALDELKIDYAFGLVPSSISRFIGLRRLSLEVNCTTQLIEVLLALNSSQLDFLSVTWKRSTPRISSTEDQMLACLKVESMKQLKSLEVGGTDGMFDGISMYAFGDECVRRGIKVRVVSYCPAFRNRYAFLNNPPDPRPINIINAPPKCFLTMMMLSFLLVFICCVIGYLTL